MYVRNVTCFKHLGSNINKEAINLLFFISTPSVCLYITSIEMCALSVNDHHNLFMNKLLKIPLLGNICLKHGLNLTDKHKSQSHKPVDSTWTYGWDRPGQ